MNNESRWMINTNTKVIMKYRAEVMALGLQHIKECTKDGVIFGAANTQVDALQAAIAELQMTIDEKNARIAALESRIAVMEQERINDPETAHRRELEEMTLEDLKKICTKYGITAKGNKGDIIEAIIAEEKGL
jgi:predicted RNase H-like nuclease (RuvC/YqgF family)